MGELAGDLAEKMNSVVASNGEVPTLVLSDWYDDGSMDLCNRFSFLHYESDFRESLKTIRIENFLQALETLFSPQPLNSFTLPLIINLEEIQNRPELITPLIPAINSCKELPDNTILRVAKIAYLANERFFSVQILKKRAEKHLLIEGKNHWGMDYTMLEILVEINPSAALRILKKTRPDKIKRDEEETIQQRVRLLSMAHEKLGRVHLAERLKSVESK